YGPQDVFTVAGVVAAMRINGPEQAANAQAYFPIPPQPRSGQFVLRTSSAAAQVGPAVKATLGRLTDRGRPAPQGYLADVGCRRTPADRRCNAALMGLFGLLALGIGAAGVYGVMSSLVAQRTRELGVRVALGATPQRIGNHVLAQTTRYLVIGLAAGLAAAWWLSKMFTSLLFGVRTTDISIYVAVAAIMLAAGLVSALVPARRAARVDPLIALRS